MKSKHATTSTMFDGKYMVTYHNTVVFCYNPLDRFVILNTDGFFTATTKKRMNEAFKACGIIATVEQIKGKWFVKLLKDTGASLIPFTGTTCSFNA